MAEIIKPPGCLPARTITIAIRNKGKGWLPKQHKVVIPEEWSKQQFLDYARAVHVGQTVRILKWHEPRVWVANPRAFANFKTGEMLK